jgi:hypothetical protein
VAVAVDAGTRLEVTASNGTVLAAVVEEEAVDCESRRRFLSLIYPLMKQLSWVLAVPAEQSALPEVSVLSRVSTVTSAKAEVTVELAEMPLP